MDRPSSPRQRILVVRPYGEAIRRRIFGLLEDAGYAVDDQDIVPSGTSDEVAVDRVLGSRVRALLVPYHGHRSDEGSVLDGVGFLLRLHEQADAFRWRALMPLTRFGKAAYTLAVEDPAVAAIRDAILPIPLDELDQPGWPERIGRHLAALTPASTQSSD